MLAEKEEIPTLYVNLIPQLQNEGTQIPKGEHPLGQLREAQAKSKRRVLKAIYP